MNGFDACVNGFDACVNGFDAYVNGFDACVNHNELQLTQIDLNKKCARRRLIKTNFGENVKSKMTSFDLL